MNDLVTTPAPGRAARLLDRAILAYQRAFAGRPSPCRYEPSCSTYAREAIELHGAGRGTWLAVRRLSRCRPLGRSGWDPVPLPRPPHPAGPATAGPAPQVEDD